MLHIFLVNWFYGHWIYYTSNPKKKGKKRTAKKTRHNNASLLGRRAHTAGLPTFLLWKGLFLFHWLRRYFSQISWPTTCSHPSAKYRYGGGRIANCLEPAWKCRSACAEHSGQKLLPVVVRRLWNQLDRARVVTLSGKHGIQVPKFLLVVIWIS